MRENMTQGEQNLVLLQSLIPSSERFYVWCYDVQGDLTASSCPAEDRQVLSQAFLRLGGMEQAKDYVGQDERKGPLLAGSSLGMQWAVTYEEERSGGLLFVIGPVFYDPPNIEQIQRQLKGLSPGETSVSFRHALCALLPQLPVMSHAVFIRYTMLFYNLLTGQQVDFQAVSFTSSLSGLFESFSLQEGRDREKVYQAERALLDMVRQGNIGYHAVFQTSMGLSNGVPLQGGEPLRKMKTSIVVFVTLVSRAAMEGGLNPEIAYALGDSYIQAAEDCRNSADLSALAYAMYHDFIYRVHDLHRHGEYSFAIQKCCDYIEMRLDKKIRTTDLADLAGYAPYYLTEKFKKETGLSIGEYIRQAKVQRAKILLQSTDKPVQDIAAELSFSTPGYFIRTFKETTGETPAQYRKRERGDEKENQPRKEEEP